VPRIAGPPAPPAAAAAPEELPPAVAGATASGRRAPAPETAAGITDLVEMPATPAPKPARTEPLVLVATARDSCSLRVQVDGDERRVKRHHFAAGETRSWSADESFRISARGGGRLTLWLNGQPVSVPADGRAIVLDRSLLHDAGPARGAHPSKPRRGASSGRTRTAATSPAGPAAF
jgi:hypothetical protein